MNLEITPIFQQVIGQIASSGYNEVVGDIFAGVYCNDCRALWINPEGQVVIYSDYRDKKSFGKVMKDVTDLLTLLKFLEDNGLIYIVGVDTADYDDCSSYLLYDARKWQCEPRSNDCWLFDDDKGAISTTDSRNELRRDSITLYGVVCNPDISRTIASVFTSVAYPTTALSRYIADEYRTYEAKNYDDQLRYAGRSLRISWLAFIMALLIPFLSLFLGNKCSHTKLDDVQFETLKQTIQNSTRQDSAIIED